MKKVTFELDFPPTINTYWRRNGNRYFIAPKGVAFREHAMYVCRAHKGLFSESDRISMTILVYPPDKRRRDLDNLPKALADSFQHAGVYVDDCQVDELVVRRMKSIEGRVTVILSTIET